MATGLGILGIGAGLIGANEARDEVSDANREALQFQQQALDYIRDVNRVPIQYRDQALSQLGGMYGLSGGGGQTYGGGGQSQMPSFGGGLSGAIGRAAYQAQPRTDQDFYSRAFSGDRFGQGGQYMTGLGGGTRFAPNQGIPYEPQGQVQPDNGFSVGGQQYSHFGNMPTTTPQGGATGQFADFYNSPDYQLAFDEGQNALNSVYGNSGRLLSGSAIKGATQYGQNLASNRFNQYANRLSNFAQMGNVAGQNVGSAMQTFAGNAGDLARSTGAVNAGYQQNLFGTLGGMLSGAGGFF